MEKKKLRNNRAKESDEIKLFIYNVPVKYTSDDIYNHLCTININVLDLSQISHSEARKKSFVVTVLKSECNVIASDETLDYLRIGVRENVHRGLR